MNWFKRVRNKLLYESTKINKWSNRHAVNSFFNSSQVASIDDTLKLLVNTDCSMCRFGDGEYKVMIGLGNGFQKSNPLLGSRLKEVIADIDNEENILICIPNVKEDMLLRTPEAAQFWFSFCENYGRNWVKLLKRKRQYYNAHVTRLYMDYQTSGKSEVWFDKLKNVWKNKNLIIVEGKGTKLGVGNDLFKGVASIKRIICPSQNAFDKYLEILNKVKEIHKDELVLIALGQTATVLAYDLAKCGIRALDIGHIDIEYEWFLHQDKIKTSINGKYVKEVGDYRPLENNDKKYLSQIFCEIL